LRETLEETGLLIGRLGRPAEASLNAAWKPYREQGVMPGFEALRFIFRAITPVYMPRRFNTRFFLADGGLAAGELKGDGELTDLRWQPRSKLGDLDLVDVTQELLKEAIRLWPIDRGDCELSPKLLTYKNNMTLIRPLQ
jgi:8-oxo-dGTP pyrophosphatase MutT (NUDIX family)